MSVHGFVLFVLALVLAALFVGCGNEALRVNASVARVMLEVQSTSGPVIRELRVDAGIAAGRRVHANGGTIEAAQRAAVSTAQRWQCAIDGHRLYSSAVGAYIDALVLWQASDDFELADAIPFVRRALDAYRVTASCLLSLGSNVLPEVPSFLRLIPLGWEVQR